MTVLTREWSGAPDHFVTVEGKELYKLSVCFEGKMILGRYAHLCEGLKSLLKQFLEVE